VADLRPCAFTGPCAATTKRASRRGEPLASGYGRLAGVGSSAALCVWLALASIASRDWPPNSGLPDQQQHLREACERRRIVRSGGQTRGDRGTGYSSLEHLRRFPVDTIKIDKAFIDHIAGGLRESALARAIVHLENTMGLATVAEGVETAEQAALLGELGCAYGQGYWFAKPMSSRSLEEFMQRPQRPASDRPGQPFRPSPSMDPGTEGRVHEHQPTS
jgi:hypothetical protein